MQEIQVQSLGQEGRSPGEGNGYPLQYSCLENPMDRGAWQATLHRFAKSQTQLTNFNVFCWVLTLPSLWHFTLCPTSRV